MLEGETVELEERATSVRTASRQRVPTPAQSTTPQPQSSAPSTPAGPTRQESRENLWQKAAEKLSEEDRQFLASINKSHLHADGTTMTNPVDGENGSAHTPAPEPSEISDNEQVDVIIGSIREVRASRNRREFTLLGQRYSLSDIYSNTISWLNKFKDIGDVATQYDPVHAALPWAATRLIPRFVVAYKENTDEAMAIIEKTSRIIHQCAVYEQICVHEGGSTKISDQIR
jgi:ankyrin repeat domain-containing protein 50